MPVLRALAAALLLALTLPAAPAAAHSGLVSVFPAAGEPLDRVPAEVVLRFGGEVREPAYVVVTAPDGSTVEGEAHVDGDTVVQAVPDVDPAARAGTWTVDLRVVSADGHPLVERSTFEVADGAAGAGPRALAAAASALDATAAPAGDGTPWWAGHGGHAVVLVGTLVVAVGLLRLSRAREERRSHDA